MWLPTLDSFCNLYFMWLSILTASVIFILCGCPSLTSSIFFLLGGCLVCCKFFAIFFFFGFQIFPLSLNLLIFWVSWLFKHSVLNIIWISCRFETFFNFSFDWLKTKLKHSSDWPHDLAKPPPLADTLKTKF